MLASRIAMMISVTMLTAMALGKFPWILLIAALALFYSQRKTILSAFGTARWAELSDLRKAGMLCGNGLPIGHVAPRRPSFLRALNGLFDLRLPAGEACTQFMRSMRKLQKPSPQSVRLNAVHTAVFAPTGVGKGVSLVIPHLLDNPESCVVIDFKGELATITAKARQGRVVMLDPFKVVSQSPDTFNPLEAIDPKSPTAIDECRALAEALVIRTGEEKEPHWNDSAEMWIAGMIAVTVAFAEGKDKSLQAVRSLLSDPAKMQAAIQLMCNSTVWSGMLSRIGHQLSHFKDKELASVLTTVNRHMRFLDTVAVDASTRVSSFDPAELKTGKLTVYLILPPEHMRAQSSLLRMWIGSMLRAVVRQGLDETRKVHFVLDEAASLGRLESLTDALDKFRGYGVRLQFYYQSLGQLKACWPEGGDQTLLSNTSQIFFGVNDPQTAEYVSNRLGEKTIVIESGGTSNGGSVQRSEQGGQSSYSSSWNHSRNWAQHGRKLLKPEEVAGMNPRHAITFTPGVPPICTYLSRYYEGKRKRWKLMQETTEVYITAMCLVTLAMMTMWMMMNL